MLPNPTPNTVVNGPVELRGSAATLFDTAVVGLDRLLARPGNLQAEGGPKPRLAAEDQAVAFSLPAGGRRSELIAPITPDREGDERWVRYTAQLRDVPVDTTRWQLILQWHHQANTGSPPLALEVGRGRLRLAHQGGDHQDLGPVRADDNLDVVLHVRFSRDPTRALVEVWRDGRQVLAGYQPSGGTLLDASNYLKTGLYRDPSIDQPSSVLLTRLAVGPTAGSVGLR